LQDRREILSHTAVRGIAAVLVVAYHLQYEDNLLAFETATSFFKRSYLFVDLFFILSGFIISYVNQADRNAAMNRDAVRRFLKKRVIRLYPLVLFCLVYLILFRAAVSIAYLALSHDPPFDWSRDSLLVLLGQLTMTNAWLALPAEWNIPSWSISAEMFAYLTFPVFIRLRIAQPVAALVVGVIATAALSGAAFAHGNLDITLVWSPFRGLAGFLLGIGVYHARHRFAQMPIPILSMLQVASVAWVVIVLCAPVSDVIVIPGFVLLVATTWTDRGLLSRILQTRAAVMLGHWSYSIYLNHVPVIAILGFVWFRIASRIGLAGDLGRVAWIATVFTVVLVVSRWTYRHVELPAQRYLTGRFVATRVDTCNSALAKE
jgi:peptidoglycan/LPS O-acetylase OafA/YrhL